MKDQITIPVETFYEFYRDAQLYRALEMGGVDNWEWFSDSLVDYMEVERMLQRLADQPNLEDWSFEDYCRIWFDDFIHSGQYPIGKQ